VVTLQTFVCTAALSLVVRWSRRELCVRCGYDLRGLESSRCPECGNRLPQDFRHVKMLTRR
jgi:predicted Zn-ribbon and HTH transcriptional regulator